MSKKNYIDGFFQSKWFSKFITQWFFKGKNYRIEKIMYKSFFNIKKQLNYCPIFIFFEVIEKIKPEIGLKIYHKSKRKISGTVTVPFILDNLAQYKKSIYWLVKAIKLRKEFFLSNKVIKEFYDIIFYNKGDSLKKKKNYYKYAVIFKSGTKYKWK
jgi:ribosomal protein S7